MLRILSQETPVWIEIKWDSSTRFSHCGMVAQMEEQWSSNPKVAGMSHSNDLDFQCSTLLFV